MEIQIYRSKKNKQFAWRIIAKNGKKIACGGETYHNKKDLKKAISLVDKFFNLAELKIADLTK